MTRARWALLGDVAHLLAWAWLGWLLVVVFA